MCKAIDGARPDIIKRFVKIKMATPSAKEVCYRCWWNPLPYFSIIAIVRCLNFCKCIKLSVEEMLNFLHTQIIGKSLGKFTFHVYLLPQKI